MLPFMSKAQNPIVQTNYTADPAPMVHNGTVYLYTSHDEDKTVKNFFTMNDWRCYSSTDMVNWTDRGAILSYKVLNGHAAMLGLVSAYTETASSIIICL